MNSTVEPRLLGLSSIDDVIFEFERLELAHQEGRLLEVGNWTAGRVFQSLAEAIRQAIDGADQRGIVRPGAHLSGPQRLGVGLAHVLGRVFAPMLKSTSVQMTKPDMMVLKKVAQAPPSESPAPYDKAVRALRVQLERLQRGEPMAAKSPVFGSMTHEQ